jgi:hypothetical protein
VAAKELQDAFPMTENLKAKKILKEKITGKKNKLLRSL